MHKKGLLHLLRSITVVVTTAVSLTTISFAQLSDHGRTLTVKGMPPNATALYEAKLVVVHYGNSFRFAIGTIVTQTPIAAATVPSLLAPSPSSGAKVPPTPSPRPGPAPRVTATAHMAISNGCTAGQTFDDCWTKVRTKINTDQDSVLKLRANVNTAIQAAALDQRCYQNALMLYAQPILTEAQANSLITFAKASQPAGCSKTDLSDPWPFADANKAAASLTNDLQALNDLIDQPDYAA